MATSCREVSAFGFDHSDPGALYTALRRLEDDGLVSSDWEPSAKGPRQRVYRLTPSGVEELDRRASELAEGERRIDAFIERYLRARRLPGATAAIARSPGGSTPTDRRWMIAETYSPPRESSPM